MWEYSQNQIEGSEKALRIIRRYGLVYIAWEERTGKTGTAIRCCEISKASKILVITKKKSIDGWLEHFRNLKGIRKRYELINYESVHKIEDQDFDIIILDEAHNAISKPGNVSSVWKKVKRFTKSKAIIYLSATPYAEHKGLLFNQLALSDFSPFNEYKNFFKWYKEFGIPSMMPLNGRLVDTRKKYKDKLVLNAVKDIFMFSTRKDIGFKIHFPTLNFITIPLPNVIRTAMFQLKEQVIELKNEKIILDTTSLAKSVHYQLESGVFKYKKRVVDLGVYPKAQYILENYTNDEDYVVIAHFIAERELLNRILPSNFHIKSYEATAEGVDLSMYKKMIICSMSFKTAKFIQIRNRQLNVNRKLPVIIDFLTMNSPAIGPLILKAVTNKKKSFDNSSYNNFLNFLKD